MSEDTVSPIEPGIEGGFSYLLAAKAAFVTVKQVLLLQARNIVPLAS